MRTILLSIYTGAWVALGNAAPPDLMPYLDKIGTVGLALLVAYLMYKELEKRDTAWREMVKSEREEQSKERSLWSEKEKYYLTEMFARMDEQRLQVNDLIRTISKNQIQITENQNEK